MEILWDMRVKEEEFYNHNISKRISYFQNLEVIFLIWYNLVILIYLSENFVLGEFLQYLDFKFYCAICFRICDIFDFWYDLMICYWIFTILQVLLRHSAIHFGHEFFWYVIFWDSWSDFIDKFYCNEIDDFWYNKNIGNVFW